MSVQFNKKNLSTEKYSRMRICTRCISTEDTPGISFNEDGLCNYCQMHEEMEQEYPTGAEGKKILADIVVAIKKTGRGRKYDCVLGVSGGCDSSYLLYKLKEMGLRILAVHFDNTWNSDIATTNIYKVLKKLDIDLYTHVVDNKEYDDIYRSFLKASVKEIDAPTDIALITTLYQAASKNKVKYIIDGHSFRTEGIVPTGFVYMDGKYIDSVQRKFGTYKFKTYPNLWILHWFKWMMIDGVKRVRPIYYMDYDKEKTKKVLAEKFGWQWYGGHHMENRFTYFAVNYYMPVKFNADLRGPELSGLIRAGHITRDEAFKRLAEPKQIDKGIIELVQKRLGISDQELEKYMKAPNKTFRDYKTYKTFFENFKWLFWVLYKLNFVPQSFYIKYTSKDL